MPKRLSKVISLFLVLCLATESISAIPFAASFQRPQNLDLSAKQAASFRQEALVSMAIGATKYIFDATRKNNADIQHQVGSSGRSIRLDARKTSWFTAWPFIPLIWPVSSTIHELGHYIASRSLGYYATLHINRVETHDQESMSPLHNMIISAAGPAASLGFGLALAWVANASVLPYDSLIWLLAIGSYLNLGWGITNLIPIRFERKLGDDWTESDGYHIREAWKKWRAAQEDSEQGISRQELLQVDRRADIEQEDYSDLDHRLEAVLGDASDKRYIAECVRKTIALEEQFKGLSALELSQTTDRLRARLKHGADLEILLPEAFAAMRETMARVLGKRPYVEQLMSAVAIHKGRIVEQKTGEGKTLSIGLAAYLNALAGPVDIYTFNEYLSLRDVSEIGQVMEYLGLKTGYLTENEGTYLFTNEKGLERDELDGYLAKVPARRVYRQADVIYADTSSYIFGYLYDQDKLARASLITPDRPHRSAIIDEVDAELLEGANTDYQIERPESEEDFPYEYLYKLMGDWKEQVDFIYKPGSKDIYLTDRGRKRLGALRDLDDTFARWKHLELLATNALRARHVLELDRDYVVVKDKVIIRDEHTGYLLEGHHWEDGLHQFVAIKEGLDTAGDYRLGSHIAVNNYMALYQKISGVTGTLGDTDPEFETAYQLKSVRIPPHKPSVRVDLPDRLFATEAAMQAASVLDAVREANASRSVLLGVRDVAESIQISQLLDAQHIPFNILNGLQARQEADVIAQAGKPGQITLATQLAGRGVDIKPGSDILKRGGLHVVLTGRSTSSRVDDQYRRRSARQGQPGSSCLFLSLDDRLFKNYATPEELTVLSAAIHRLGDGFELTGSEADLVATIQKRAERDEATERQRLRVKDAVLQPLRKEYYTLRQDILARSFLPGRKHLLNELYRGWVQFISAYEDLWREHQNDSDRRELMTQARQRFETLILRRHETLRSSKSPLRLMAAGLQAVSNFFSHSFYWKAGTFVARMFVKPFIWAMKALGNFLLEHGRLVWAYHLYKSAARLRPNDALIQFQLANSLYDLENYEEAMDHYVEAFNVATEIEFGWNGVASVAIDNLALAFFESGRKAQAEGRMVQAAARYYLSYELNRDEEHKRAWDQIRKTLSKEDQKLAKTPFPEMRDVYLYIARENVDHRDYETAEYYFTRALDIEPDYSTAYYGRGYARDMQHKADEAEQDLFRGLYYQIIESRQFGNMRLSYSLAKSRSLPITEFDRAFNGLTHAGRSFSRVTPLKNWEKADTSAEEQFKKEDYRGAYLYYLDSLRGELLGSKGKMQWLISGHKTRFDWSPSHQGIQAFYHALKGLIDSDESGRPKTKVRSKSSRRAKHPMIQIEPLAIGLMFGIIGLAIGGLFTFWLYRDEIRKIYSDWNTEEKSGSLNPIREILDRRLASAT